METRYPSIPRIERSLLVVVDCQEGLWKIIQDRDRLAGVIPLLIKGAHILDVPILVTEQYPKGLGKTLPEILDVAGDAPVVEKTTFSCWGEPAFQEVVRERDRTTLVLCGIETHVCVLQTALDALSAGFDVHVVADATGTRASTNHDIGLARMRAAGAVVTCVESLLFEWMERSDREGFKDISGLLK